MNVPEISTSRHFTKNTESWEELKKSIDKLISENGAKINVIYTYKDPISSPKDLYLTVELNLIIME